MKVKELIKLLSTLDLENEIYHGGHDLMDIDSIDTLKDDAPGSSGNGPDCYVIS